MIIRSYNSPSLAIRTIDSSARMNLKTGNRLFIASTTTLMHFPTMWGRLYRSIISLALYLIYFLLFLFFLFLGSRLNLTIFVCLIIPNAYYASLEYASFTTIIPSQPWFRLKYLKFSLKSYTIYMTLAIGINCLHWMYHLTICSPIVI